MPRLCVMLLTLFIALPSFAIDTLINPDASNEARSLISFLEDTYGKRIISGQQEGSVDSEMEFKFIFDATGKTPAIRGFDFMRYSPSEYLPGPMPAMTDVDRAIEWYRVKNGIVTFCWHWWAPMDGHGFYTEKTQFDIEKALTPGTPQYAAMIRDLDVVARELKKLRDAQVPVLWRPLHEASGKWFWWGVKGQEPFKRLWRLMYDRFTNIHKLNNLIWVFTPGGVSELESWYPGEEYVDIIGQDIYLPAGVHSAHTEAFEKSVSFCKNKKLVTLSENGPQSDPNRMLKEGAGWLYFSAWYGHFVNDNEQTKRERLKELFAHPYVMTLDQLPDLRTYPHKSVGAATHLDYVNSFPLITTDSLGGKDIVVAVHDNAGRTVRDVSCEVTLDLLPEDAPLKGATSVFAVNGVARFEGLRIPQSRRNCILKATTRGFDKIESPRFEVRSGGIYREWWYDIKGYNVSDLTRSWRYPLFPTGGDIIKESFETGTYGKEDYGQRFRAYITAPTTGDYTFWISADDKGDLYLSSDEDAENRKLIARSVGYTSYHQWDKEPNQQSRPIRLSAGKKYYIEAIHKQATGGEHLSVGWALPNGIQERPIPAYRLEPFDPRKNAPGR